MRKSLLLMAASLLASGASARTLTPAEALNRAGDMGRGVSLSRTSQAPMPIMTIGQKESPAIYLFNKAEGGYVVVSADDVAAPVLGYSDSGAIDPQNLPENFAWWLGEYEQAITSAVEAGASPYLSLSRADFTPIQPLMTTLWDQGSPYNLLCPQIGTETTVTGCVATAMAQVMKYHNWPEQISSDAVFSYNWESGNKLLSWNAGGVTLDWANMLDTYNAGNYTTAQANAVATLMKACGYSVSMEYDVASKGGSGAATIDVGDALIKYFNYDKGVTSYFRTWFGKQQWEEMIYNNLRDCGPVLFSGSNPSGGHAFVCDGYRSDGYFHINWGWSGISNGYFLLNALDPDNQGIGGSSAGYNNNQMAILGIKRPGENKANPYLASSGEMSATIEGASLSISFPDGIYNYGATTLKGILYAHIVAENGSSEKYAALMQMELDPLHGYNDKQTFLVALSNTNFPSDGTYKVSLTVKLTETGEYKDVLLPASESNYILLTREGRNYTATVPAAGEFSIYDLTLETPMFTGSTQFLVKANGYWTGESSVVQTIYGALITNDFRVVALGSALPLEFNANNEATPFEYLSKWGQISAGNYNFCFITPQGKIVSPAVMVEVSEAPTSSAISVNTSGVKVYDTPQGPLGSITVSIPVTCTSGYFFNSLAFAIFDSKSHSYVSEFDTNTIALEAGQSGTVTGTGSIPGAVIGSTYLGAVFNGNEQLTNGIPITIGFMSGIDSVISDEPQGEVEYYNLQGIRVDNPSGGIFIRRQGGKSEKVYLK